MIKKIGNNCRNINLHLVEDISKRTSLDPEKLLSLLKILRVSLDSNRAKNLLVILYKSDPESIIDAYYSYVDNLHRYEHGNASENIRRFLTFLTNSKRRYISLDVESVETVGMFDKIDDEVSSDELKICIEDLENEN